MKQFAIVILIFAIILISTIVSSLIRNSIYLNIYRCLNQEDYESIHKSLEGKLTKLMVPVFTREMMRLNVYIKQKDEKQVTQQINQMMKLKLNAVQRNTLLKSSFEFYIKVKMKGRCKKIIETMKQTFSSEQIREYVISYEDTFKASL